MSDTERWVSIEKDGRGFVALAIPGHDLSPIGPMPVREAEALAAIINAREAALLRGAARTELVVKINHAPLLGSPRDLAEQVRKVLEEGAAQGVRFPVRVEAGAA